MDALWLWIAVCAAFGAIAWFSHTIGYDRGFRDGDDAADLIRTLARKRPPVLVRIERDTGGYVYVVGQKWLHPDAKFVPELRSGRFETVIEAHDAAKRFWPDCQPEMERGA